MLTQGRLIVERPSELNTNSPYLNSVKVNWECPRCGTVNIRGFNYDHLSHPNINTEFNIDVYCKACCEEYSIGARLNISLEIINM